MNDPDYEAMREGGPTPEQEAEIWADILAEDARIDRRDYWRTLWRLVFGPGVVSDLPNPYPPEEWTPYHRAALFLVMVFGSRAADPYRGLPDVDVITLNVSHGYGCWSSRSVGYWPGKWQWDIWDDGDSSL